MNNLVRFFLIIALTLSAGVGAHEGHDHAPVSMKKAADIALATARDYTLKEPPFGLKKLDESWRNLPDSSALIHENGRGFYVVSVTNPQQQKTLYVRILLDGTVDDANFSGHFNSSTPSPKSAAEVAQ